MIDKRQWKGRRKSAVRMGDRVQQEEGVNVLVSVCACERVNEGGDRVINQSGRYSSPGSF